MKRPFLLIAMLVVALGGCEKKPPEAREDAGTAEAAVTTNRVDIPLAVRQNLGITFARVERRQVARTLRVPGRFELLPTAKRDYRVPVAGRVEILVRQYEEVEAGRPLYRLDAPAWRELQRELVDVDAAIRLAEAGADSIGPFVEAHERHHTEIQASVDLWTERVASLEALRAAGGAGTEELAQARAALATARAEFAETLEKEAELTAREREVAAQLTAAQSRYSILMDSAAWLTGLTVAELEQEMQGKPRWRAIGRIEVVAGASGVVDTLEAVSGGYVEQGGAVLTTVQPRQVRFRASALQSDMARLPSGSRATAVPPQGGAWARTEPVTGTLMLAPTASPERRTVEAILHPEPDAALPDWAKAGVSGFLEIVVEGGGGEELAIPLASVVRDGTQSIIFRRDPGNPDKAIRMEADLGTNDGRWVVIRSGVGEGNEVVLDGVYQLMVSMSGSITKGGHFHPDGTFHEGED